MRMHTYTMLTDGAKCNNSTHFFHAQIHQTGTEKKKKIQTDSSLKKKKVNPNVCTTDKCDTHVNWLVLVCLTWWHHSYFLCTLCMPIENWTNPFFMQRRNGFGVLTFFPHFDGLSHQTFQKGQGAYEESGWFMCNVQTVNSRSANIHIHCSYLSFFFIVAQEFQINVVFIFLFS